MVFVMSYRIMVLMTLIFCTSCDKVSVPSLKQSCNADKIAIGIDEYQVLEICGKPSTINVTDNSQQWIYRGNGTYVYIEDGKVTSKQWKRAL